MIDIKNAKNATLYEILSILKNLKYTKMLKNVLFARRKTWQLRYIGCKANCVFIHVFSVDYELDSSMVRNSY